MGCHQRDHDHRILKKNQNGEKQQKKCLIYSILSAHSTPPFNFCKWKNREKEILKVLSSVCVLFVEGGDDEDMGAFVVFLGKFWLQRCKQIYIM